jgi:hypothetical protein
LSIVTTKAKTRTKVTTPWGPALVIDEVKVTQRAGDRRFATMVQLLESEAGESLVRIAYTTDGVSRRGPVTLRAADVEKLRTLLAGRPGLAGALGMRGAEA